MYVEYSPDLIKSVVAYGLSDREAKIYLAGLELGASSILELAKRTELPRTTLYPILDQLCHKGIFQYVKRNKKWLYIATPPAGLAQLFQEREAQFNTALPELESLSGVHMRDSGITYYEGTDGFKQLWQKIFRSGVKEYRLLTNGISMLDYVKEPYIVARVVEERVKRGIKSLQLIPESRSAREIIKKDSVELRESRFLPKGIELGASVVIFGEDIAFITTRKENAMIVLASGDIAKTHRVLFDALWVTAPKP